MHTTIIPITKDNRLSARDLYNPMTLRTLQTEYNHELNGVGFDMQRGVTSDRKHIELEKFKHETKITPKKRKRIPQIKEVSNFLELFRYLFYNHPRIKI